MPQQINSNATLYRQVESDVFSGSTNDGTTVGTASPNIDRNPDIGSRNDVSATDTTGSKTGISLWKGLFDLISTFTRGAGNVSANTLRVVLAQDGPTVSTLTNLLNATTLATPNTQTETFTIPLNASLSDYKQLKGRSWLVIFPSMTGANVKIRIKTADADTTGNLLRDDTGNPHEFLVSTSVYPYSAQATAFLSAAIGSQIAFESYSDATTTVNQASAITITLKAVV